MVFTSVDFIWFINREYSISYLFHGGKSVGVQDFIEGGHGLVSAVHHDVRNAHSVLFLLFGDLDLKRDFAVCSVALGLLGGFLGSLSENSYGYL